jgi:hypothetical protein
MNRFASLTVSAALAASAIPAFAENCTDTHFTALASSDCRGSFSGNINGAGAEITFLDATWGASFTYLGKSDDPGSGPFTGNPAVTTNGTLTFDSPISGEFIIGLKAADNFSYYLFDAASPITSLTFDTTAGVGVNQRGMPQGLSHANLYVGVTAVPEPETYALMLAGLAIMGWFARRRIGR